MSKHKNTQTLGLFGTYAVLMKLTELGWTAIATPGNSKNTDIIAYKETGKQTICKRIEVKTTSNNFMWPKKKSKSPVFAISGDLSTGFRLFWDISPAYFLLFL